MPKKTTLTADQELLRYQREMVRIWHGRPRVLVSPDWEADQRHRERKREAERDDRA